MDFLSAFHPLDITLVPPNTSDHDDQDVFDRKLRTYNREIQTHQIWNDGSFDGFISLTSIDPRSYMSQIVGKLEMSSNIAVYSNYREVITELQHAILTNMPMRPILAPTIHEIRSSRWSTLKGRVRPNSVSRGGGGWILSGTRVEKSVSSEMDERKPKKKRKLHDDESMTGTDNAETESSVG
jgi:tRNA (adenine58-N1)-methyltransferase non-catalytic subunit